VTGDSLNLWRKSFWINIIEQCQREQRKPTL
jgi:hypothetical protein